MDYKNYNLPPKDNTPLNIEQERQVRELIAASLANWTGITRFRTIESTITTISDFTLSQHNHQNAAGGGQLNPASCFSAVVPVANGGTGLNTITNNAVVIGQAAGNVSTITGKSGTFSFYVAASSGGAVTTKVDCDRGVITAVT